MKTRIFIGSSKEGLDVANYIKNQLEPDFECYIWTDNIFKYNTSFLDTLLKEASLFDFGILIATKDDYSTIRETIFKVPRDNIVFEFGLFIGRLGPSKAFLLQEKGVKLPSDLLGITIPTFKRRKNLAKSSTLNEEIKTIRATINEKVTLGELGLLPSTVIAIGYYFNFISIICETLHSNPIINIDDKQFRNFELNVIIPKDLDADIKKRASIYFINHSLKQIQIVTNVRSFPIFVSYDESQTGILKLFDMPFTLNSIDKAIEMYMHKGYIGKTSQQKLLEERELRNFQTTLQHLILNDAFCQKMVKVISEE